MKLSEHFDLSEMIYSDTAIKYGVTNYPSNVHLNTLKHTCEYFLEPLRELFNIKYVNKFCTNGYKIKQVQIKITSGYRSNTVNQLLKKEGYKPSEKSQHCNGEAVDFMVILVLDNNNKITLPYNTAFNDIQQWVKDDKISVDQCLLEKQGSMVWIHASYSAWGKTKNRNALTKLFL